LIKQILEFVYINGGRHYFGRTELIFMRLWVKFDQTCI